jgi:hypothetical protein
MRNLMRGAVVFTVLAGIAAAACSSSSNGDSATGGTSSAGSSGTTSNGGKGGASTGTSGSGGATNGGASGAGASNAGTGGTSVVGSAGADDTAGAENGAGGSPDQGVTACNALAISGAAVNLMHVSTAAPTLSNGTLQPGDYRLTSGAIYDGGTGTYPLASIAHVSIADSTATIQTVDEYGDSSTLVIEMAAPSSLAPTSVKLTCDSDPLYAGVVGSELKSDIEYGATETTFSLYEGPSKYFLVYTLGS